MRAIYAPISRNRDKLLRMDTRSAELTKYAANVMLATRIRFMNELERLAERVGADIERVRHGIGSDPRIGTHFLYAGTGYGGSCFPKGVKALLRTGHEATRPRQGHRSARADCGRSGERWPEAGAGRQGRRPFWRGSAGTPLCPLGAGLPAGHRRDLREAPSRVIVHELLRRGAAIRAYDPVAMDGALRVFGDLPGLSFASHQAEALWNAHEITSRFYAVEFGRMV
jgi:UDPglucose 6-dehydrogenase